MARSALVLLLAVVLPASASAWSDKAFCEALRPMVNASPSAFESLRGDATEIKGFVGSDYSYTSTLLLPGADSCTIGEWGGVNEDRSLTCKFGDGGGTKTEKLYARIKESVEACVTDEWTVDEGIEGKTTQILQAKAPGGMDATSVVVQRVQEDKRFRLDVRVTTPQY
jgi:hypothetical protein